MLAFTTHNPLSDITNLQRTKFNHALLFDRHPQDAVVSSIADSWTPLLPPSISPPRVYSHNPYNWKCVPDDEAQAAFVITQRTQMAVQRAVKRQRPTPTSVELPQRNSTSPAPEEDRDAVPPAPAGLAICRCLIQFKCHQAEYSSTFGLDKGQYIVVQGDRGIDIGVVIRVNTDASKAYIERTGPCGAILRHATQREVDYWASELKADEAAALDFCRQRVTRHQLVMDVRHAEYQFDKKKLTFYYDAKSRVDFVNLLKELYREYGCRIWMEKVRSHE